MRNRIALLALATALTGSLSGCGAGQQASTANALRGVSSVNVPVVTRADYTLDLAAPDGSLAPGEQSRLDGWFRGLDLGYGDNIYVDGAYADGARRDVARVAGHYGMMVGAGAPVTASPVAPGQVRVVVARTRAGVPNCPNWVEESQPSLGNHQMPNFGCGVNGALAAMVANPEDLVHGREGSGVIDAATGAKAIDVYRKATPTGTGGLKEVTTKGGK